MSKTKRDNQLGTVIRKKNIYGRNGLYYISDGDFACRTNQEQRSYDIGMATNRVRLKSNYIIVVLKIAHNYYIPKIINKYTINLSF